MEKEFISYSDGGARGNPGPAGIGAVLLDGSNELVAGISQYIGETTNNQAEYRALIAVLEKAKELRVSTIVCHLDSELVVKQLNGEYKVKNRDLAPLFLKVQALRSFFANIKFVHVRREFNQLADALANKAMDSGT